MCVRNYNVIVKFLLQKRILQKNVDAAIFMRH